MERVSDRVCLPSIWFGNSTQDIYQTYETSGCISEADAFSFDYLARGHPHHGNNEGTSALSRSFHMKPPGELRVHRQLPETMLDSLYANAVSSCSWSSVELRKFLPQLSGRETKEILGRNVGHCWTLSQSQFESFQSS